MKKIAEFYGFEVYSKNKSDILTIYYNGGQPAFVIHMSVCDGSIQEEIKGDMKYHNRVLKAWYNTFSTVLIEMCENGDYQTLSDWQED